MSKQASEQPPATIILNVNCIVGGVFHSARSPLPFTSENALPEALRAFIATAASPPPEPPTRNIYDMPLALRRQVRGLELGAAEKAWAEEQASEPLREDLRAALEDAHDRNVSTTKAQMEYNQGLSDAAYARAAEEAEAKTTRYFVKRGGEMARVERARLKPAETVFTKRENGQYEAAGVIDANGEPLPPEITI
jgi:hypothetical protein